jgi:dihydrofolate reductase
MTQASRPLVRYYVAASVDGYIATPDGGVGWLDSFNTVDYGFDRFFDTVDTVIMGRATYQQTLTFPGEWSFKGKRTVVMSSSRALRMEHGAELFSGEIRPLVDRLKTSATKDIWLVGGGETARRFVEAGAVDKLELTLVPVVLGGGIPLFGAAPTTRLELQSSRPFQNGAVELIYDFSYPPRGA